MVAVLRSDVVRHRAVVVGTAARSCLDFWGTARGFQRLRPFVRKIEGLIER